MKIKIIGLFAILCLLAGCNDTDVLDEIEQEKQTRMLVEMQKEVQKVESNDEGETVATSDSTQSNKQQLGLCSLNLANQANSAIMRLF